MIKIKRYKMIKNWNREVFGDVDVRYLELEDKNRNMMNER